jgi:AcrR family transcriptional regulator
MPQPLKRAKGRPKDAALTLRRREQILGAAAKVFARHGFADADVQLVADAIGVGKGTVYRYFPTKRELFLAAVDRGVRRLGEHVREAARHHADPLDRITAAIHAYLAFFDRHPELVELFIQERAASDRRTKSTYFRHHDANIGRWQDLLRELISAGRVRDVPIERICDVLGDLMYGSLFTNYFAGRRKSFEAQARDMIDVVYSGILTTREKRRRPAWTVSESRV